MRRPAHPEPFRELVLLDGRRARLRPVDEDDASDLAEVDLAVVRDGRGVVLSESQVAVDEVEQRSRVEDLRSRNARGDASEHFVAEVPEDGPVRAVCTLTQMRPALCRHVGVLAIGVHPEVQGVGVGRALLELALAHARAVGLTRVELYVRADNARARRLYDALGFEIEGVRRAFVRTEDGVYVDDLVMGLLL